MSKEFCLAILDEEFVRAGDTVYSAGLPMTPQEHRIFNRVQEYLVRYIAHHTDDPDRMPGVTKNSVLGVKFGRNFSKKWSVLLNLKSGILPRTESRGDDPFYAGLGTFVRELIMKEFRRELGEGDPCSNNGPAVFMIFDNKTQYPDEYRTDEWLKAHHRQRQGAADSKRMRRLAGNIVVSSGHGRYLNYADAANPVWAWQRPQMPNGLREDIVTIQFGRKLGLFLEARDGDTVIYTRDQNNTEIDPDSGLAWWKVAARYYLKRILPDRADIWDAGPGVATAKRDYNDDVDARPLYANAIGADGMISLHTNAEDGGTTATGTRLFIHPTLRTEDVKLRDSMKCYMEELFKWQSGLGLGADWPISYAEDNLGEVRIPVMPTVLVEIGFHTNPSDAAKLVDPVFQSLAMKGVEKGWRLYALGKPCTPLAITSLPLGSANDGSAAALPVGFVGFPRSPIRVEMLGAGCPSNYDCTMQTQSFSGPRVSPLPLAYTCKGTSAGTKTSLSIYVQLVDADGAKSNIRLTFVDCKKV